MALLLKQQSVTFISQNILPLLNNFFIRTANRHLAEQLQEAWAPEGEVAAKSGEILTHLQGALQATVSGAASAEEAAAQAQEAIDETLAAE